MRLLAIVAVAGVVLAAACGGGGSHATAAGGSTTTTTSTTTTITGTTSCAAPEIECGGACVDPTTAAGNCGVCGFACQAGETCCEGACSTACALGIASVSPAVGPMSGGTWITVTGQGFAPGAEVHLGTSRAPALVVSAQTLTVLSPPGLAGSVALRVDQGASHAERGGAFQYSAYGLQGTWQKIDMSAARGNWPGVAVLQDGRVLISGGVSNSSGSSVEATADLYDPAVKKSAATAGDMSAPRWTQASVTLLGGKVLVLGTWFGGYSPPAGPIADLFDAQTKTFTPTASPPSTEHRWPHAVLLADGRALVVSGASSVVELYDPVKDAFSLAAGAPDCTGYRPARLLDGRVLLVKGAKAPLYVFDPDAGTFTTLGTGPTAVNGDLYTLPDGRVLDVAGSTSSPTMMLPTGVLEIFDPTQQSFMPAAYSLPTPLQEYLTTAMAGDGTVLVLGGDTNALPPNVACATNTFVLTSAVEQIDPVAGAVSNFASLPDQNFVMSAVTMHDGSIVAAGGAPCGAGNAYPYFYYLQGTPIQ